jgi:transaldolase
MTSLDDLYSSQGQSPWIDNLNRPSIRGGGLAALVDQGIRGVTSNPTIFEKAMTGSDAYDEQFARLIGTDTVEAAFWEMAIDDVSAACEILASLHTSSGGTDGFVSLEVSPSLANDTDATIQAARNLHGRVDKANLMVKIPATPAGVPAVGAMISEGRNINVTLIFSLRRYAEVIEAYLSGLESFAKAGGDVSRVHSVASFFVSRVDTEVDRRLSASGSDQRLFGKAAVAQAKLAYELFQEKFSGARWQALADAGAHPQRPLWASTSTKNPAYPDLLYVDTLIGPNTVNTMPDATVAAFLDHGSVARTVDTALSEAHRDLDDLGAAGIDMDDVSAVLESQGVASFLNSWTALLGALEAKAAAIAGQPR